MTGALQRARRRDPRTKIGALLKLLRAPALRQPEVVEQAYASQPGLGVVLGARVLAEFGDEPNWFADAKARKHYSGEFPVTRASGRRKVVIARYACNRRLTDAQHRQAFCALLASLRG